MKYLFVSKKEDPEFYEYIVELASFHQCINDLDEFPLKITGPKSDRKVRILSEEYPLLFAAYQEKQHG